MAEILVGILFSKNTDKIVFSPFRLKSYPSRFDPIANVDVEEGEVTLNVYVKDLTKQKIYYYKKDDIEGSEDENDWDIKDEQAFHEYPKGEMRSWVGHIKVPFKKGDPPIAVGK